MTYEEPKGLQSISREASSPRIESSIIRHEMCDNGEYEIDDRRDENHGSEDLDGTLEMIVCWGRRWLGAG